MPKYTDEYGEKVETRKFPDGYTVVVLRKEDIIASIDANILPCDKDIALDIVKSCEISAANHIENMHWASLPFMGSLKFNHLKKEVRERLTDFENGAGAILDKNDLQDRARYCLFKKRILAVSKEAESLARYYTYVVTIEAKKHEDSYVRIYRKHGAPYARLYIFFLANLKAYDHRFEYEYDDVISRSEAYDKQQVID